MQAEEIRNIYETTRQFLNERDRRLLVAAMARAEGYGGISKVSKETGVSRKLISKGCAELDNPDEMDNARIRKKGAGRKKITDMDPTILNDLERLIEPVTRGDPESNLRWTCKSTRNLSEELSNMRHEVSHNKVGELLRQLGYSLQSNQKVLEGTDHPDRDAQFRYINEKLHEFQQFGAPVISVDTKKKELVGNFKNGGRELRSKGNPEKVNVHDFPIPGTGKVNPYGVYDVFTNSAWVSVGTDHDTGTFAVETIRRWWYMMGKNNYPEAKKLLITADGGGSNGYRIRLWKVELQKLADETGLMISVCHFPPGTSKWNKIEHRLFAFITQNWRGKPLISHEVIVNLIAATTTRKGLCVQCNLDINQYPVGIKVPDEEMELVNIIKDKFHGEWNYTISPRSA
jgi:transposase